MSKRILLVSFAIIIGYFAIFLGDELRVWENILSANNNSLLEEPNDNGAEVLFVISAFILFFFGCYLWIIAVANSVFDSVNKVFALEEGGTGVVLAAAGAFILFAYIFGILATPFTAYGAYPWYWASKWDVLLLISTVPLGIVICDIVTDIRSAASK